MTSIVKGSGPSSGTFIPFEKMDISGISVNAVVNDKADPIIGKEYKRLIAEIEAIVRKHQSGGMPSPDEVRKLQDNLNALKDLMEKGMPDPGAPGEQLYLSSIMVGFVRVLFAGLSIALPEGSNFSKTISFGADPISAQANAGKWLELLTNKTLVINGLPTEIFVNAANSLFVFNAGSPWQTVEQAVTLDWLQTGIATLHGKLEDMGKALKVMTDVLNNLRSLLDIKKQITIPTESKEINFDFSGSGISMEEFKRRWADKLKELVDRPIISTIAAPGEPYLVTGFIKYLIETGAQVYPSARDNTKDGSLVINFPATPPFPEELKAELGVIGTRSVTIPGIGPATQVVFGKDHAGAINSLINRANDLANLLKEKKCTISYDKTGALLISSTDIRLADYALFIEKLATGKEAFLSGGMIANKLYKLKDELLAALEQLQANFKTLEETVPGLNPTKENPKGTEDPNGLAAKVRPVLEDLLNALKGVTKYSPPSTWIKGVRDYMMDGAGTAQGMIYSHIDAAITSGQHLNDTQTKNVEKAMMVFTQFVQIASDIIRTFGKIKLGSAEKTRG